MTPRNPSVRRGVFPRSPASGFTLIEALIALVVLSLGILTLGALMPLGTKRITRSDQRTRASELASTCAERLLTTPYADPDLDAETHNDPSNPYPGGYYVQWVVEDNQPISACKRITVTTHWPTSFSPFYVRMVAVTPQSGG